MTDDETHRFSVNSPLPVDGISPGIADLIRRNKTGFSSVELGVVEQILQMHSVSPGVAALVVRNPKGFSPVEVRIAREKLEQARRREKLSPS